MNGLEKMPPQYTSAFLHFLTLVRENFARPEGVLPVFIIGSALTGKTQIVGAEVGDKKQREEMVEIVRKIAADMSADFVFFVSEGYRLEGNDAEEVLSGKYPDVKSHPKHLEVVSARFETLVGCWGAEGAISRPEKLGPRHLSNWAFFDASHGDGIFSHFLDKSDAVS